jgi:hypothetical protein
MVPRELQSSPIVVLLPEKPKETSDADNHPWRQLDSPSADGRCAAWRYAAFPDWELAVVVRRSR